MSRPQLPPWTLGVINISRYRSGTFRARARYRDGGGRLHELAHIAPTEKAARKGLEKRFKLAAGGYVDLKPKDTVETLARMWLRDQATATKRQTRSSYEGMIRLHILRSHGAMQIRQITTGVLHSHIQSFIRLNDDATWSTGQAKKIRSVWRALLSYARLHGAIDSNPVRDVPRIPKSTPRRVWFDVDQLDIVLSLMRNPGMDPAARRSGPVPNYEFLEKMFLLCLGTGLRPGEMLALRRRDVAFDGQGLRIHVDGTNVSISGSGTVRQASPKNLRQKRTIRLPSFAAKVIQEALGAYVDNPDELLFLSTNARPIAVGRLCQVLKLFRERHSELLTDIGIDVPTLTFRGLRKTVASIINAREGLPLATNLLGHSSEQTTIAYYLTLEEAVSARTAEVLDLEFPFGAGASPSPTP